MNLKNDLKSIGYLLITPVPTKYHFEGVNNRRAMRQLTLASIALPLVATIIATSAPVVIEEARRTVRFLKDQYHYHKK